MVKHTTTYVFYSLLFFLAYPLNNLKAQKIDFIDVSTQQNSIEQNSLHKELALNHLIEGEAYLVHVAIGNPESCLPITTMESSFEILREDAEQLFIRFEAQKQSATLQFKTPCLNNEVNTYIVDMQCTTCAPKQPAIKKAAVIQAEAGVDENVLVKDVFVAGGCYDVENITYRGGETGKGTFNSGDACLLYTSPSPRDRTRSRMPSSA